MGVIEDNFMNSDYSRLIVIRYKGDEDKFGSGHNIVKGERFKTNIPKIVGTIKTFLKNIFWKPKCLVVMK
ncbi:MAG: hypothetical protein N4A71_04890 [Carboxylicivirga sp.]|jgi:hypothetical protein|nr:hypothetical protein [Carboxylicivirga sp.]MCT4646155.1 hypothetical protein [Carboxylicivirga sp.]